MARRKITEALTKLAEAFRSYGYAVEDGFVFEVTLPEDVAQDIIDAIDAEASAGDGLITDEDSSVPDLGVKPSQALADYRGIIISKRRV